MAKRVTKAEYDAAVRFYTSFKTAMTMGTDENEKHNFVKTQLGNRYTDALDVMRRYKGKKRG